MALRWEKIDGEDLYRAKVFGGWLVSSHDSRMDRQKVTCNCHSICFVPDPHWSWKLPEETKKPSEEEE